MVEVNKTNKKFRDGLAFRVEKCILEIGDLKKKKRGEMKHDKH
jgi:hypothetical protein